MKNIRLDRFTEILQGELVQGNPSSKIENVSLPTLKLEKNTAYFHVLGINFDSLKFDSFHTIVTSDPSTVLLKAGSDVNIIRVTNTTSSYWKFVEYYRGLFNIPVIGITGTCGKTTTTEMVKKILQDDLKVESTTLGLNALSMNLRYLTRIDESTEAAVYELGVTHPGNITRSCKYLKPNIGIITNIDLYHTLGCGTLENYIEAKAELLEGLGNTGILILNTDSPNIRRIDLSKYNGKIYYFGINGDADFKATNLQYSDNLVQFDLIHNNNIYKCSVIGHGDYNVYNALAAIASVTFVGVGIETACRRLATFGQLEKHVEIRTGNNKCRIIDDTWNNSSLSMNTALDILERDNNSKKIAVLGAMFQLGDYSKSEHRNIGFKVAKLNLDYLITLDEESAEIAKAAIEMGMDQSKVHMCLSGIEAWEKLQPHLNQDTTVLTKYSYHYRPYDHMRFFVNNLLK